jgi:hypothetical protein
MHKTPSIRRFCYMKYNYKLGMAFTQQTHPLGGYDVVLTAEAVTTPEPGSRFLFGRKKPNAYNKSVGVCECVGDKRKLYE